MKKIVLLFIITTFSFAQSKIESNQIVDKEKFAGIIHRIDSFPTKFIVPRTVDVWLPSNYSKDKKYSVLYMHDGQMLFDASITWNKQEWGVDEAAGRMMAFDRSKKYIVVGIHNISEIRHSNYFPQKPFESLSEKTRDSLYQLNRFEQVKLFGKEVDSDNYIKFIVNELKPFIDSKYSTLKNASNTFIAGSSMGGLISWYAVCEYPEVFGGAACLSTHWVGVFDTVNNPIPNAFINYLKTNLPDSKSHKFYFDFGTGTLDAMYPPLQAKVDEVMQKKGYTNNNWITQKFEGAEHSENAWRVRLHIPFEFLLKK